MYVAVSIEHSLIVDKIDVFVTFHWKSTDFQHFRCELFDFNGIVHGEFSLTKG